MVERTFVISEAACTWSFGLDPIGNAYRSIEAAKSCGADAWKTQFTSDATAMAKRRGLGADAQAMYAKYLQYPVEYLHKFKAKCDEVGVIFMCSVFLPKDCDAVSSLAHVGKISAFESDYDELISVARARFSRLIISVNAGKRFPNLLEGADFLYCVSEYPTPLEHLYLSCLRKREGPLQYSGISDHTTSTLTGALAVAAGARVIEKHVRLDDTPTDNPDHDHSLCCEWEWRDGHKRNQFAEYVENIRTAEVAL